MLRNQPEKSECSTSIVYNFESAETFLQFSGHHRALSQQSVFPAFLITKTILM